MRQTEHGLVIGFTKEDVEANEAKAEAKEPIAEQTVESVELKEPAKRGRKPKQK